MSKEGVHQPEGEQGRVKTLDERYAFRGYYDREPGGECRNRILQEQGKTPILIITELPDNETTSVTNMMETLAPELIGRHLPHRYEVIDEEPAIVIEHYPPVEDQKGRVRERATYDRVTFDSWRPKKIWMHGQERVSLGDPEWRHMPDTEVRTLLGDGGRRPAAAGESRGHPQAERPVSRMKDHDAGAPGRSRSLCNRGDMGDRAI